jgi:hypothetical protein
MRFFILFSFFISHLIALSTTPLHTTVQSVDLEKEIITINSDQRLQIGMYGVISHRFDAVHATALSWVEVSEITDQSTTLKLIPIYALEQSALPTGNWQPKVGDEVMLPYNYHRALLIAPNRQMYNIITRYHKDKKWVHFDKSLITVDCHSFTILENVSVNVENNETQLPFYTRVSHIEANWFGEGSDELEDYAPHYINLLVEMNPENQWIKDYQKAREALEAKKAETEEQGE